MSTATAIGLTDTRYSHQWRSESRFVGLVLAGGPSARMGCDKADLRIGHITLLDRAVDCLHVAGAHEVLVSGTRPLHRGIPDRLPARGPLVGISSVLYARSDLCNRLLVITPVDMPFLSGSTLLRLAEAAAKHTSGVRFLRAELPVAVHVTPSLVQTTDEMIENGDSGSVRKWAMALGLRELIQDRTDDLSCINTPMDLRRACERNCRLVR